jgi:murein DD-endopeptidase MepM/ murein hydrolase activator NlpD
MKKEIEVIITHLDKPKTYQRRFTLWQVRFILVSFGLFVLLAVMGILLLHYTNQQNVAIRYLYERNIQLEHEASKLSDLQNRLNYLEAERAKIAMMLGFDKNPPPIDLSDLTEEYTPFQEPETATTDTKFRFAPTTGYIISRGFTKSHTGVDFAAQLGMPVFAIISGTVEDAGVDTFYGNYITILSSDNYKAFYGHLYKTIKTKGESVNAGDIIGYVGSSGKSTAPHLHFELWQIKDKKAIALDPEIEMKGIIKSRQPQR